MTATMEAEAVRTDLDIGAIDPPFGWSVVWGMHGWSDEDDCPRGTSFLIGSSHDPEEVVAIREQARRDAAEAGWPGQAYVTDAWGRRCRMLEEAMVA